MKSALKPALLAVSLGLLAAPAAHADIIGELTVGNDVLSATGSGPYASYDIAQLGGNTFEISVSWLNGYVFGGKKALDLNLSAAAGAGTLTSSSGTLLGGSSGTGVLSQGSASQVNGFGTFNFVLNDGNGFSSGGYTSLVADFSTDNAVSLSGLLDGTLPNIAGHLKVASGTCTGYAANGGSDPVGTCGATAVREPSSLPDLGFALVVLGVLAGPGRRFSGRTLKAA